LSKLFLKSHSEWSCWSKSKFRV